MNRFCLSLFGGTCCHLGSLFGNSSHVSLFFLGVFKETLFVNNRVSIVITR